MAKDPEITVMAYFKPFLNNLAIFNKNNFQNQTRRNLYRNIFYAIVLSLFFIGYTVAMLSDAWHCVVHEFDVATLAFQIGFFSNGSIWAIAHMSIRLKNEQVKEVIDNLAESIKKRKYELGLIRL